MDLPLSLSMGGVSGGGDPAAVIAVLLIFLGPPVLWFMARQFLRGRERWGEPGERNRNLARMSGPVLLAVVIFGIYAQQQWGRWADIRAFRSATSASIVPDDAFDDLFSSGGICGRVNAGQVVPTLVQPGDPEAPGGPTAFEVAVTDAQTLENEGWNVQRYVDTFEPAGPLREGENFMEPARVWGFTATRDNRILRFGNGNYSLSNLSGCGSSAESRVAVDEFPPVNTLTLPWLSSSEQRELATELVPEDVSFLTFEVEVARGIIDGEQGYCHALRFNSDRFNFGLAQRALDRTAELWSERGWAIQQWGGEDGVLAEADGEIITLVQVSSSLRLRRYPAGCNQISGAQ